MQHMVAVMWQMQHCVTHLALAAQSCQCTEHTRGQDGTNEHQPRNAPETSPACAVLVLDLSLPLHLNSRRLGDILSLCLPLRFQPRC